MTLTHGTVYSEYATGLMKGKYGILNKLNSAFDIPGDAGSGVAYVHMWDTVVSETPSAGTFLAQGMANTATLMSLTHKFATALFTVNTIRSMEASPGNRRSFAEKIADQLICDAQAAVIAALKAGSITTNAKTFTTTYIDFAIPSSSTTTASMVLEYLQPFNRNCVKVKVAKQGAPFDDFWILMPSTAFGNLEAMNAIQGPSVVPLMVTQNGPTDWSYKGIPVYVIDGTNFGGASYEVAFIGHKEGFAYKDSGIQPWRGGEPVEDGDGQIRMSFYIAYATGLPKEALLAECVNPKS